MVPLDLLLSISNPEILTIFEIEKSTLFSFFANNSRMKQPTPVFLSYMDIPYAIEGGSTIKFFWVLNKLYMAKREAILRLF